MDLDYSDLPSLQEIEKLFINSPDLRAIENHLNRFNPIRVMKMEHMEIRHSAILGWLLDPNENHGLGDKFLKAFLSASLADDTKNRAPTALEVGLSDLSDAIVRVEWERVDILIHTKANGWVFVVENKYGAKQYKDQLKRYRDNITAIMGDEGEGIIVRGLFLTLNYEAPEDPEYVATNYTIISDALSEFVDSRNFPLDEEVAVFIKHYLDIIKEDCGMSDEHDRMAQLAQALYRRHQKVLDFIWEHGTSSRFTAACEAAFGTDWGEDKIVSSKAGELVGFESRSEWISFLPKSWFDSLGGRDYSWPGCEKFGGGFPVQCWIELVHSDKAGKGNLRLQMEVGPLSDGKERALLIQSIKDACSSVKPTMVVFRSDADHDGKRYSRFGKNNQASIKDITDHEEIRVSIDRLLGTFKPVFDAIAPVFEDLGGYEEVPKK